MSTCDVARLRSFVANNNVNKVYVQYEILLLFQLPLRVVELVV